MEMTPAVSSGGAPPATAHAGSKTPVTPPNAISKDTFLKLLVAQIRNQDPLSPTDSIQFVSQLAQFSELEQLIGIREGIDKLTPAAPGTPAPKAIGA